MAKRKNPIVQRASFDPPAIETMRRICYHEASHALVARTCGRICISIGFWPDDRTLGELQHSREAVKSVDAARDDLAIACAGSVGANMHDPSASSTPQGTDSENAWAEARRIHGLKARIQTLEREVEVGCERARRILREHWVSVDALARSLFEVLEVIRRHDIRNDEAGLRLAHALNPPLAAAAASTSQCERPAPLQPPPLESLAMEKLGETFVAAPRQAATVHSLRAKRLARVEAIERDELAASTSKSDCGPAAEETQS